LNYDEHDYFYFCAKDDFSGYHSFAKNYTQHKRNAKKFQKALDQLRKDNSVKAILKKYEIK